MKNPSRLVSLLGRTVPLAAALSLDLPPVRAVSNDLRSAVGWQGVFAVGSATNARPAIEFLAVTPGVIRPGMPARLRWSAPGAVLVRVTTDHGSSHGAVTGNNLRVRPTRTTTYTLTAIYTAGEAVKSITLPVLTPTPAIPLGWIAAHLTAGRTPRAS
jgi:hypothetical protein